MVKGQDDRGLRGSLQGRRGGQGADCFGDGQADGLRAAGDGGKQESRGGEAGEADCGHDEEKIARRRKNADKLV